MRYIRFVMLCDNAWNGETLCERLVGALSTVLYGVQPSQDDWPDADYFVEGSAQWWGDDVRVRLAYCDIMMQRVRASAILQRNVAIGAEPIAREAVNQLYTWLGEPLTVLAV